MKPWERYSSGPWTRFKGVSSSDDGVAPFALPEEEPTPRFQTRGLGVPAPVLAPVLAPVVSRADTTDDARAERGFGRSAYLDDGMTPNLPTNTPTRRALADVQPQDYENRSMLGVTGDAVKRGALRTASSLPLGMATSDATALQDAARSDQDILWDTFKQFAGADAGRLRSLDISTPEKAAQALASTGAPAQNVNTFRQIYDQRLTRANDARQNRDVYVKRYLTNAESGGSLLERAYSIPMSDAAERMKERLAQDESFGGTLSALVSNPLDALAFLGEVGVESAPAIATSMATAAVTRNPVLSGVALGAGSAAQEFGASAYDVFQDAGLKIDSAEAAKAALDNPALWAAAGKRGATRATVIALFEMMGQGVAAQQLMKSKVGDAVVQTLAQIGTGAGGEAAAQFAAGEKLKGGEILIEGLAEGLTAPFEIGSAAIAGRREAGSTPPPNDRERINSPRLTDNDRASPIPNDIIDDGKAAVENLLSGRAPTAPQAGVAPLDEAAPNVRTPTQDVVQRPLPTDRLSPTLGAAPSADALPKLTLRPSIGETPSLLTGGNLNAEPVFIDSVDAQTIRGRVEATGESFEIPAQSVRDGLYSFQTNQSDPSRRRSIGVPEIDAPVAKSVDYAKVPQRVLMLAREGSARLNELTLAEQTEMRNAGLVPDELESFNIHALEQEAQDRMARGDWDASQSIFAKDSDTPAAQDVPQRPFEDVPEMDGDVETGRNVRVYEDGQVEFIDPQANQEQNAQTQEPVPQTQEPVAVSDVSEPFKANVFLENEDLTSIEADPETFQYKSGGDAEGVTDRLLGVKRWETDRSGQAIVYEYADGRRVIADGHQRLGLAKRLRAEGQDVSMPVTIFREVDGYKPDDIMVRAALKNVAESDAKDPNPEAIIDAAKVLRARPNITPADMNLPNGDKSALGRNALSLRNLSDEAFGMVVNERASMRSAIAVANAVSDKAAQANILSVVEKSGARNRFEAEMVAKQAAADTVTQTQDSLFGSEDVTETLYLERARVMDQAIKRLRTEASAFKTILRNAGNIEGVGDNRVDRDASAQKAAEDAAAQEYITRLANSKGPISDALTEAARSLKAGGNTGQAVTSFVQAVRSGLQEGGAGREGRAIDGGNPEQVRGQQEGQVAPNAETGANADLPALDVDTASKALADARQTFDRLDADKKIENAQEYFAASSALSQARDGMADALSERGGRIELKTANGLGAVITPRPDGKAGARITYFDGKGFSGDTSHDTLKAAVRDAIGQGYEIEAKGYLKNRQALWPKSARTDAEPPKQSAKTTSEPAKTLPKLNEGFVIRNKDTGEVVMETRDQAKIDALNTDKYEAVPVRQHLAELNQPNSKAAKAARKNPISREALQARDNREAITPETDTVLGKNEAGETIYQQESGQIYRMRNDRPDFGGDLAVVNEATTEQTEAGTQTVVPGAEQSTERSEKARNADRKREADVRGQQSKMRTGVEQNAPGGLFDTDQGDMFGDQEAEAAAQEYKPLSKTETRLFNALRDEWVARESLPDDASNDAFVAATEKVAAARKAFADEYGDKKVNAALEKIEADYQADPNAPRETTPQQSAPTAKIEDFGEKLEGAQKDKVKGWLDRANQVADSEIENVPLSKAWPEPDYQAMIDEGIDPEAVAFMHAARDEIPNKPRQKWKVERWAQQVKVLRTFTSQIASGDIDIADVKARMTASMSGLRGRMALYEEYGHEKSLKDITLKEGAYSAFKGERFDKPRNIWTVRDKGNIVSHGATEAEAIAGFSEAHGDLGNLNERTKGTKFEIRKWRGGSVFIGKKVGKDWIEVETNPEWDWKDARAYLAENQEALEAKFKRMKELPPERGEDNSPRVGVDHRNGQDVTPEMFSETFGFRGVQFGNYVEGPRRQADLNEAYDGLMDLAGIINVPPKAMSLNGTLGLAFGARGSGRKAKAHYEPDTVVINLTKGSGAGSLAHEWWHGLDHYFAKQGGKEALLLTETGGRGLGDGIRPEVVAAFQNLITAVRQAELNVRSRQADKRKSKPYFSKMEEMTARSFESYVIGKLQDQSASNDYLANILSEDAWNALEAMGGQDKPSWPYVTVSEMPAFREAFDKLFDTIKTEETADGTVRLFQRQLDTFAADFLKELAAVDELFAYPKSTSTTVEGVFADIDPMVEFIGETQTPEETAEKGADERYLLRSANGKDFYVYQNADEVWIDVSQVGEGGGGNSIYAAIGDYAFNTDRKFIGDPEGLSQIALRRRTEAMLSSALKHGTTEHLAPHQYQLDGDESIGVPPLAWTRGDTVGNIQSLIEVSNASLTAIVPEIENARYDFQTRTFRDSKGERLSDEALDDFRDRFGRIGEAGAGRRTLKRGILYATLLRQESGKRPGLLERALRQSDKYVNDGDLKGTFYQRSDTQDAATVEAALPDLRKRLNQMMLKRVSLEAVEGATFQGAFEARGDDLRILVGATQDSMKTVNHEAVHALRNLNLFTDAEWDALSDQAVAEWLDKYDIANRYDDLNAEAQIEEAIAEAFADFVAEQTEPGPIKSAFAKMRRMFRALKEWVTGNPSVQGVFEAVDSGRVGGRQSQGGTDTRALQKQINTATEAFKRWFGDSKVVDADGKPLVVYRGMSQDMQGDAFRVSDGGTFGEGIYLTSDPEYANIFADGDGGQVFPVYASIQNPAPQSLVETVEANATAQRRSSRAILEDMGYDGMIAEDGEIVAFRPEQIKSVYNRGTFDPNDARIRYQRQATARQKAQETFDQMPRDVAVPNRAVFDELFARNRSMFQNIGQAKGAVGDRMDVAREYMQDRILPLRRAQEAIERETGQPIAEAMNAYVMEETYHGKVGRRLDDIQQFTIEPIRDLIAESNDLDTAKVNDYLTALHAEERNARIAKINPAMPDGGSGMTNAEAQKILKDAKMSKDYAALKEIDRLVSKLRDDTLQLRVDAGLMTAKDAALLKAMYKNYVPLKGFEDFDGSEVLSDRPNIGRGFSVKGPESKRALGRKSRSFDVLANILSQAQEVAIRAEKNRVGKAMFDLASQYPSENLWKVREVETKRVFNKQTGLVETRSEAPTARALAENEMAVKIDGKEYRIEFMDKRLTRAMGAVKVGQMGDLVRILSLPARYFSAVNTMIDPEFVVRNAFRDMQAAQINIRNFGEADRNRIAKGMIANWPKAFAAAYKGQGAKKPDTEWTQWYREFEEAGGKVSFWKMEDADRMKSDLDRQVFLKRGNIAQRAGKFAITPSAWFSAQDNAVLGFIERTNLAVDNAVRLAAYVEARKSGWSKQKAASLSKNLTVNFNRRGHYGPVMNALYPFYNAGMQGTQVLFRAMSNPKRMSKYVVGMIGVGFISDLINAAISDEDDDGVLAYDKIQKFKQEMSFQISTGDDVLTVPLSYGYNVFPYMGQLAGQVYRGVKDPDEAFVDFVDAAVSAFSPVYESDAMRTMLPMVLDLPYDLATNSDWLHRPIRPEQPYGDYGPDAYKFYGGASEWAKGLADVANRATGGTIAEPGMIDISPEYLDHIWGFASGGAGRFVSNTGDMAAKILSGKTDEIEGYRVPFARQVFSETGVFLDRDRYYRFRDKVNAAAEARETAQEAGEPLSKLSYDLSKLKNEVKLADKVLRAIRKERAAVGDDATADQRKEWEAREAKAILRFNQKYVNIAGASIE